MDDDECDGMPWCEPCGSYHHKTAPGCRARLRGYPERDDEDELFAVRGGQGRSADELLEASGWLTMLLAIASAAIVGWVVWRICR
jgi:hypothetical protein